MTTPNALDKRATVTDLRTRRGFQPDFGALARNQLLLARANSGLSPGEFAAQLSPLVGWRIEPEHIHSWENEVTPPGDVLIAAAAVSPATSKLLGITSHKFIAAHVGPEVGSVTKPAGHRWAKMPNIWPECRSVSVSHPDGRCSLQLWPFGSAIFHLVEDLDVPDIASLALWRYQSYEQNLAWASNRLRELSQDDSVEASYVFSFLPGARAHLGEPDARYGTSDHMHSTCSA